MVQRSMRAFWRDLRAAGAALTIVILVLGTSGFLMPTAARHCPTAAVQQVFDPITHELRTIEPGDSGFVACHCGEKAAARQSDASAQVPVNVAIDLPHPVEMPTIPELPVTQICRGCEKPLRPGFDQPSSPPPDRA